jgi:hypothetical protein
MLILKISLNIIGVCIVKCRDYIINHGNWPDIMQIMIYSFLIAVKDDPIYNINRSCN